MVLPAGWRPADEEIEVGGVARRGREGRAGTDLWPCEATTRRPLGDSLRRHVGRTLSILVGRRPCDEPVAHGRGVRPRGRPLRLHMGVGLGAPRRACRGRPTGSLPGRCVPGRSGCPLPRARQALFEPAAVRLRLLETGGSVDGGRARRAEADGPELPTTAEAIGVTAVLRLLASGGVRCRGTAFSVLIRTPWRTSAEKPTRPAGTGRRRWASR